MDLEQDDWPETDTANVIHSWHLGIFWTGLQEYRHHQNLPLYPSQHRAVTLRWRLYAMAAKVVKTGRQLFVKLKEKHRTLLEQVLMALKEFEPPPI